MASQCDGNNRTFPTATAIEPFRAVTINSSGNAALLGSGAGATFHGVSQNRAVTAGDPVSVKLKKSSGTMKSNMATTGAVADVIYAAAGGQGTTSASGSAIGTALEACTTANGTIEMLPA